MENSIGSVVSKKTLLLYIIEQLAHLMLSIDLLKTDNKMSCLNEVKKVRLG